MNGKITDAAVLLLLLIMGCSKSNTSNCSSPDLFPNTVGDTWHYLVRDSTLSGDVAYPNTPYNIDVKIVGTVSWPKLPPATIWQYKGPGWIDTNYIYKFGDTIRFMDITNTEIVRQYIFPFTTGSSWPYIPGVSNVTVTGKYDIIVGNKPFADAWQIYGDAGMPDASFTIGHWFKDKVGFVRMYLNPSGELILTKHIVDWQLVSWEIN